MRFLIKLVLALACAHGLFLLGFPHVLHRMLGMRVREIVAESRANSEQYIESEILAYAHDKKIPLEPNRILVWRVEDRIRVVLDYEQTVEIPFYTTSKRFSIAYPEGTTLPRSYSRRASAAAR
ncbi:MAG: hypothetical protein ABIK65_00920 [Candidatus Eisenbacteria bacterium]